MSDEGIEREEYNNTTKIPIVSKRIFFKRYGETELVVKENIKAIKKNEA